MRAKTVILGQQQETCNFLEYIAVVNVVNLSHFAKYFIGGKGSCGCLNLATNCLKFEAATYCLQTF